MKKLLSLLMAVSVVSGGASAFAANSGFTDILEEKYAWARPAIEEMAEQGYIKGYDENTFGPDNKVTRLDTIILFSRAMGANRKENNKIIAEAREKYASEIKASGISYGEDEVSFMLARGVLTEADIKTFLSGSKASQPMPRQEAAAIITKAMCAEEAAKEELLVDLEYTDAKQIAPAYSQYVFYVSEKGIMNGMDDGGFEPENSVLRSQIAVMLSRTVEKMNLYIETALVTEIDTKNNNITIVDSEDAEIPVGYTDYTKFFEGLEPSSESKFVPFSEAMLTYINNELVFVDMYEKQIDETAKGIYQGSITENGTVTVTIKPDGEKESKEYELSSKASITSESGSESVIRNIAMNSYIEYDVAKDMIISIRQIKKDSYINSATVESISIDDELYLVISHSDSEYDGMKFALSDNVAVYKNNDRSDLSKIYKGDKIDLTLEYGQVTKIVALSNTKTYEGTISEVVISSNPVLKVKINGEIVSYDIVPNIAITVNGEEGTLYDLRVGDTVKVTIESGAVLKIVTTAAAVSSEPVSGVVEIVNTSMGFIKINGETIFCKDGSTTFINSKGSSKSMRDLKEGITVSVRGSMQNGAYNASLIIIEE
jgi:hypothetical protein